MATYRLTVTITDDPREPFDDAEQLRAYVVDDLAFYAARGRRLDVRFPGVGFDLADDPEVTVEATNPERRVMTQTPTTESVRPVHHGTVTRSNQRFDVIYSVFHPKHESVFVVAPDGEGRYWYDTVEEAREEHGDLPVVHVEWATDEW